MKTSRKRTHAPDSGGRASERAVNRPENVDLMRRPTEDPRWASKTDREDPTSPSFGRKREPQSEGYVGQAAIPPVAQRAHTTIA